MIQQLEKQIDEKFKKTYRIDEINQDIKKFKNESLLGYNYIQNNPEEQKFLNNQMQVKEQELTRQEMIERLKDRIEEIKIKMNEILNQFNLLGQYEAETVDDDLIIQL